MPDREKLSELIKDGRMCPVDGNPFEEEKCMQCKYREDRDCDITRLADYLIANGVTFATDTNVGSKWMPVTEGLPIYGERVLVTEGAMVVEAYLSISHKWVRSGFNWEENVTHWMPLPDPPEEVARVH